VGSVLEDGHYIRTYRGKQRHWLIRGGQGTHLQKAETFPIEMVLRWGGDWFYVESVPEKTPEREGL
jgi:hypothetical protein